METKNKTKIKAEKISHEKHTHTTSKKNKVKCCINKDFNLGFAFGLLLTSVIIAILINVTFAPLIKNKNSFDSKRITTKIENFINNNLLAPGTKIAIIEEATKENGLYKVVVDFNGQELDTYMTEDEEIVITQAFNIKEMEEKNSKNENAPAPQNKEVTKNDKPVVELFVMSHCPYGTQIEKGILPVAKTLGDKIDFEIKFCDYAMHGEKELDEQLQQHCIKTEQPTKFVSYLECFLEAGDSKSCLTKTGINTSKLNSCISTTDKKYSVNANFNDKNTWKGNYPTFNVYKEDNVKYNVGGSPTLVINGTTLSSGRDSKSLLAIICSAFETPPEECNTDLSSAQPSPGFGSATTTGGSEASCN
ncbi:MAG: hypothetical protein P1P85_03015 [Patescibacteria group bacterium]|nr:hypothetical protein [Patescibacteria group bacterium]